MVKPLSKSNTPDDPEDLEETMHPHTELVDQDGPIWVNRFTEDSARAFVKQLQYQSQKDQNAPIVIYVDSSGGEVYALFAMIAAMESVPNQIVTIALGKAMSAGALLLAYGDLRYASQHATIMVHEISAGTGGHIADMDTDYANITQLNERLLELMAERCKIKGGATALKKKLEKARDLFLTPQEALELGVVDRIGFPIMQRKMTIEWGLVLSSKQEHLALPEPKKKGAKNAKSKKSTS